MRVPASITPITAACAAKCCALVKKVDSRTDNSADFHCRTSSKSASGATGAFYMAYICPPPNPLSIAGNNMSVSMMQPVGIQTNDGQVIIFENM